MILLMKNNSTATIENDTVIEIINLHPQEIELIKSIRNKWSFGEITIIARDGLPVRLRRVTEFIDFQ